MIGAALLVVLCFSSATAVQETALTLDEALAIARERFPAILAAKNEVVAAQARVRSQGAFPNPRLGAKREEGSGDREEGIELTQEIEVFGQWLLRRRKASWELRGKEQDLRREVLDLTLRVKTAFFELIAAETVAEVARENLSVAERLLKAARTRFETGDAPRADWIKAEVEYTRALQEVLRAQRSVGERRAGLGFFLGWDLAMPLKVVEPPLPKIEQDVGPLRETALRLRPEVRRAEAGQKAAESQVSLAKSKWLPTFSVSAEYMRERKARASWEYLVGPKVSIPIFDFGSIRGDIQQAKAAVEASRATVDLVREQVALEVEEAWLRAQEAQRQLESFETGVLSQAEQLLKLTLEGYEQGALTLLDFLEAQRSFRVTRTDYAFALRNYREAAAQLDRVVGASP
jgi:cobalt-zinc-cadmium efflux system outer membrane protein